MSESPDFLRTRDLLRETGITHQILYRYVTMGLVREEAQGDGGHRVFPPETVGVIKLIQRLNQSGYTLRDIKDIFFKDGRLDEVRARRIEADAGE